MSAKTGVLEKTLSTGPAGPFQTISVAALLAFFFLQVFFSMQTKSPTVDEFAHHVASGYSHLVTGDFRMNPAAPPLPRLLSAIPLYFIGAKAPLDDISWRKGNSPDFARKFFFQPGLDPTRIIFWARLPILFLSVIFGFFVYRWAAELFGFGAGLSALALYSFCPDVLAHAGLATSDMAVAFFFFMTIWRFWKFLRKQTVKNIILTGIMAGCALVSKFSAALIFPALLLITLFTGSWKKTTIKAIVLFFIVCFLTVWASYFFEVKPLLRNTPDPPKKIAFIKNIGGDSLVRLAETVPMPLTTFSSAFVSMMMTRAHGTNAYFMGEWSGGAKSWWNYYLTAFSIKNTIPFLILTLLSFFYLAKLPLDHASKLFLMVPILLFFAVTLRDRAQAGIRYFLPIYPLFFILCGGWISVAWARAKALRVLAIALLLWHAMEALGAYPHYFSYFNELIGGPDRGYLYLRDSNIDWGQDLKGLAELARKENYEQVVVASNSIIDLEKAYGLKSRPITQAEQRELGPYVYAISVHGLDIKGWPGKYRPAHIVGHSIWIYDFRQKSDRIDQIQERTL